MNKFLFLLVYSIGLCASEQPSSQSAVTWQSSALVPAAASISPAVSTDSLAEDDNTSWEQLTLSSIINSEIHCINLETYRQFESPEGVDVHGLVDQLLRDFPKLHTSRGFTRKAMGEYLVSCVNQWLESQSISKARNNA